MRQGGWIWVFCVTLAVAGCDVQDQIDPKDQVLLGKAFVEKRQCGQCHDSAAGTLAGQTTTAPSSANGTRQYGSNLTPDPRTGLGTWADIQIIRALRAGTDLDDEKLCPTMPHLDALSDLEANAIVAYLRSLPPITQRIPPSVCPPTKGAPPPDLSVSVDMSTGDGG